MSFEIRASEPERFGDLLRRLRLERNLTQEALALRARLSIEAVSALERGVRRAPQRQTLELLATALGLGDEETRTLGALALVAPQPRRRTETAVRAVAPAEVADDPEAPIGRESDLAALRPAIRAGRILTIAGPGGIGKTTVARTLVAGAAFVPLAPASPGGVPSAVAAALGIRTQSGPINAASILDALRLCGLASRTIVLDNCEHVADEARSVADELAAAGGLAVIATSRQPLHSGLETVHRLEPLASPPASATELGAAEALAYPAVRLFERRAREAAPSYRLTGGDAHVVAEICQRLDGNALAIELAARRVAILPPRDLRRRLDARLRLIATTSTAVEPRHRTLQALVGWSFDLLAGDERRFLTALGAFGGPFSLDAAAAVASPDGEASTALDSLETLAGKSLVTTVPGDDVRRYGLLETIAIFARAELERSAERAAVLRRFVEFLARLARTCLSAFEARPRRELVEPLLRDGANLAAAFDAAIELGDAEAATLFVRLRWLSIENDAAASDMWDRAIGIVDPARADLLANLWLLRAMSSTGRAAAEACDHAETALSLARASGDRRLVAGALTQFASTAAMVGRPDDADAALGELAKMDRSGLTQKRYTHARAMVATYRGDREAAAGMFRDLAALEAGFGNDGGRCVALINVAEAEFARGDALAAVDAALRARSLETSVQLAVRQNLRANLAGYHLACGETELAIAVALEALASQSGVATDAHMLAHAALAVARRSAAHAGDAARLWGYAIAEGKRLSAVHDHTERATAVALREELTASLGPETLERLVRAGTSMTAEEARAIVAGDHH